jgi:hypothetical protein
MANVAFPSTEGIAALLRYLTAGHPAAAGARPSRLRLGGRRGPARA